MVHLVAWMINFQECGRASRSGEQAFSTIYWCPSDAPMFKDTSDHTDEK